MNKLYTHIASLTLASLATLLDTQGAWAQDGPGSAFSYQGRLTVGTNVAIGLYDLRFSLYTTSSSGSPVAGFITNYAVPVSNGLFTTSIDFGAEVFNGANLWLETAARSNNPSLSFTTIAPRHQLTTAPYAIYALKAATAGSVSGLQIQQNGTSPSIVFGFSSNSINSSAVGAVISGGGASGQANVVAQQGSYSVIAGGAQNTANYAYDTISGGAQNIAQGTLATIGGGANNNAAANNSTVGGGTYNTANGIGATVAGGYNNGVNNNYGTVGGGQQNLASVFGTVSGGQLNSAAGINSAVGGGSNNLATGYAAAVPGGQNNVAAGSSSFAAGLSARANHAGSFVWADSKNYPFPSLAADEVSFRCGGGTRFVTEIDGSGNPTKGVTLAPSGESWGVICDRNAKKNFQHVDTLEVLEKLAQVPIQRWNYRCEANDSTPHLGPVAQDFKAAFFPGRDDKMITTLEFDGVELAAIQGLNRKLEQQVKAQQTDIEQLKRSLEALKELVTRTIAPTK